MDNPIHVMHAAARANYDKLAEAHQSVKNMRQELDKLSVMGDTVEPEDVVKSAATLVGKGFHAHEMAVVLSSMPAQGGEMLHQWILTHDQALREMESRAEPMMHSARHQLGVAALHSLMHDHVSQPTGQPMQSPMQTGMSIADQSLAMTPTQGNA